MSDQYIGEIRMFGGNFAPQGWAFCEGQELSISENDALYSLIGTTYGGDGENTFALPDLRGRLPIHQGDRSGSSYILGAGSGTEEVQLDVNHLPAHSHTPRASDATADSLDPQGALPAHATRRVYGAPSQLTEMAPDTVGNTGGNQPHANLQPYLCVSFIIALVGIYPPRD